MDDELWCVHLIGPDALHPMPSLAKALRVAHRTNEFWLAKSPPEGDENYVLLWANVTRWPYDRDTFFEYAHDADNKDDLLSASERAEWIAKERGNE